MDTPIRRGLGRGKGRVRFDVNSFHSQLCTEPEGGGPAHFLTVRGAEEGGESGDRGRKSLPQPAAGPSGIIRGICEKQITEPTLLFLQSAYLSRTTW